MVKGIVTYISHNRSKTATKIRIGSRRWILYSFFNTAEIPIEKMIGAYMTFQGKWKKTQSHGRIFFADSYEINSLPDMEKTFSKVQKVVEKNKIKIAGVRLRAIKQLLILLFLIGKKGLLVKFLKWHGERQNKYIADPYLFYLNKYMDFYSADVIVLFRNAPVADKKKIQAVTYRILDESYRDGKGGLHLYSLKEQIEGIYAKGIDIQELREILKNVRKIVVEGENAYIDWIYYLRKKALNILGRNEVCHVETDIKDGNIKEILKYRWSVLSGGAGTGKTTLLNKLSDRNGLKVVFSATTGKAAKILSKEAVTVHHLLGYGKKGFSVKRLEGCDLLVVDEASMLDWQTLYAIVRAVPRAVFAGDPKQLPPVHGESVFKKLLEILPVVELEKTWRFANIEQTPNVEFIKRPNIPSLMDTTKTIAAMLKRQGVNFQVLTPIKSRLLGIDQLNIALQRTMNSVSKTVGKKRLFKISDKVIVKRNVYIDGERIASNGETGIIKAERNGLIEVEFDNKNTILLQENEIELAYALTVHKAQGSEYDYVVFVIPPNINVSAAQKESNIAYQKWR